MIDSPLYAILADPADDNARLVYADWCEERGESERAEFVRLQCRIAALEATCSCGGCVRKRGGGQHTNGPCAVDQQRDELPDGRTKQAFLRQRQATLLGRDFAGWFGWEKPVPECCTKWHRGFVSSISLPCDAFLEHAAAIFAAQPVTEVRLTDRQPTPSQGSFFWHDDRRAGGINLGPAYLPAAIYDLLDWTFDLAMENPVSSLTSITQAAAALSTACVNYGRTLAGLPLSPSNGILSHRIDKLFSRMNAHRQANDYRPCDRCQQGRLAFMSQSALFGSAVQVLARWACDYCHQIYETREHADIF